MFHDKNEEADKKINEIKELKSSWGKLEVEIKSLVPEINQIKVRMQEASVVPHIYPSAPVEEPIGGFQRGQAFVASKLKIMPPFHSEAQTSTHSTCNNQLSIRTSHLKIDKDPLVGK